MKNDFDFIKEKMENSGVNAPEDMGASYALGQIRELQPKPVAVKKPRRRVVAVAAAAASFVIIAASAVAIGTHIGNQNQPKMELPGGLTLRTFSSRNEIKSAVEGIRAANQRSNTSGLLDFGVKNDAMEFTEEADGFSAAANAAVSSDTSSGGSAAYSDTYTQVEGVDEADIIKTDGRYLYCVDYYGINKVVIFSAEGKNSRRVAEIDVNESISATPDEATPEETVADDDIYDDFYYSKGYSVSDLYLRDNRLIVLCEDYTQDETMTSALVYDVSDIGHITLLGKNAQSGYCSSSRMIGDMLYTVSSYSPYNERFIPLCGTGATPEEIPCDCVYALEQPDTENFLVISAFDTRDFNAQTESRAILGAVDDLYCNENNMYIYTTDWNYGSYVWYDGLIDVDDAPSDDTVASQILKIDLTDGLRFVAYTEVEGYIDDQYALDEYQGNLRVATTTTGETNTNNLFVLDANLNKIGEVTGFARDESIKAVRYMGDTAYVITYEQTDPLFVIDLSAPAAPAILGEVKISGFSTMLVPVDANTVLGIGYHTGEVDYTDMEVTDGLKLALFDVSDKSNPQVLDSVSYVDCDSPVQYNPRALVYNPDRGDYVIPLNYHHYEFVYDDDGYYGGYSNDAYYGGMLNFKVEGGKLVEIDRYAADYEEDVERCAYVGNTVYMTHHDYDGTLQLDAVDYR